MTAGRGLDLAALLGEARVRIGAQHAEGSLRQRRRDEREKDGRRSVYARPLAPRTSARAVRRLSPPRGPGSPRRRPWGEDLSG